MKAMPGELDSHLEAALREATDDKARYHIRQALQLRVVKQETDGDRLSA